MSGNDFSLEACMKSVLFSVEQGANPFEELGRAVIRAGQDVLFNKTMIDAWKAYITENGMKWDEKREVYRNSESNKAVQKETPISLKEILLTVAEVAGDLPNVEAVRLYHNPAFAKGDYTGDHLCVDYREEEKGMEAPESTSYYYYASKGAFVEKKIN